MDDWLEELLFAIGIRCMKVGAGGIGVQRWDVVCESAGCMWQVRHKVVGDGVLEWVEEERLREELGGGLGVLRMLLRGYLVAGAKSFTHMITALERYCTTLHPLLHETGHKVCTTTISCQAMMVVR